MKDHIFFMELLWQHLSSATKKNPEWVTFAIPAKLVVGHDQLNKRKNSCSPWLRSAAVFG
jgi:hypothetical protein